MSGVLRAPFPWFGGKSRVGPLVWSRFRDVANYVEPFAGSLAVLLARPERHRWWDRIETVNDLDGFVSNFWRAVAHDPEAVARYADWPVNECVPAGTMIATPAGDVAAENIQPGMLVWGERAGEIVPTPVIATKQSMARELHVVGPLRLTGNHPVWTAEHGYLPAGQLDAGMRVAMLNYPVNKLDLIMLQYPHGNAAVGDLRAERSAHGSGALYRRDVPGQSSVSGTHVTGSDRRQDTPRLLDSVARVDGRSPNVRDPGDGAGRRVAGPRAPLDRAASSIERSNQSHRWGRWRPRVYPVSRVAAEVVKNACGCSVFAGASARDAWQEPYARSASQDRRGGQGSEDVEGNAGSNGRRCEETGDVPRNYQTVGCGSEGPSHNSRTSPKDRRCHGGQKAGDVRRNGRDILLHHCRLTGVESERGVDQSGDPQGLSLSWNSLGVSIPVYNFQTATGNYFANRVLVHNCDLHARHSWLVRERAALTARLTGSPEYYDARVAGWWVWGLCAWIGGGWCSGDGPWQTDEAGALVHLGDGGQGINRKRVHLGDAGKGINRKLVHLGAGKGINRQLVHLGEGGQGVCAAWTEHLIGEMQALSDRLRRVRVCAGDWQRVLGPTPTVARGLTGVFLDPPYADTADRVPGIYAIDDLAVAHAVRDWAVEHGDDPRLRIALCGYEGEHTMPDTWHKVTWKAHGGYGRQGDGVNDNARKERIWFSPGCLVPSHARGLFDALGEDAA